MKKSLVALAALAVAGVASAQSSVTLFGVLDASISHYDTKDTGKQTVLGNGGYNSSRLGFRGTEDLGGGLAASFWLEAPLSNDDGSQIGRTFNFARRSTVSLSGGFGEVRLGRDYTATFWNDTVFDPFGTNGVGTNLINVVANGGGLLTPFVPAGTPSLSNGNTVRANNVIGYFLPPNLGGFYGQVQYGLDENIDPEVGFKSSTGRLVAGRFGYANGPLDVALAYSQSRVLSTVTGNIDANTLNLGASYDFGVVKLFGELSRVNNEVDVFGGPTVDADFDGFLLGATVPVGAGLIRVSGARVKANFDGGGTEPRATKFAIGYVHNLSKRTALYATFAHVSNKDGANFGVSPGSNSSTTLGGATNKSANGYDFGIRHAF
jgi:predicted porin